MNNWLKILKFTYMQAIKSTKFIISTILVGIAILIATGVSIVVVSGALNEESQINYLESVYLINETDLSIDIDSFVQKHQKEYPFLSITLLTGISAEDAASDPSIVGTEEESSLVLNISEDGESCNLTIYIPANSTAGSSDAEEFADSFSLELKNAKIKSIGISEEKLGMAISDLSISEVFTEESEEEDFSFVTYMVPMIVMMILYFLIILYGQSIGQIISMEKTSKLMEYILTLSSPTGIIFGKVSAIFCEALTQIFVWIVCGVFGLMIGNTISTRLIGDTKFSIITLFMDMLPDKANSANFYVLMVLAIIALLVAFLFYSFISALFASFAATAEELTQTQSISVLTLLAGFLASLYVPLFTDYSKVPMTIIRIIPITSAFILPADIICARISIVEFVIYLTLLLFFTVMLAVLTGRVYKNRLFKKGTKGIFKEILGAITGKATALSNNSDSKAPGTDNLPGDLLITKYERYDRAKKAYTVIGFSLLTLILGSNVIGGIVGNVLFKLISGHRHIDLMSIYQDTTFLTVLNIISIYVIACPLCALVAKLSNDSVFKVKETISKNQYLRLIFIMFPVTIALSYFSNYLASLLSGGEAENSIIESLVSGDSLLAVIMVSVLAPIFEELIFRKLIIDRTRKFGEAVAIIYSAFAFGIFHCNVYQIFYAFALGLILGYVYVRTGNVLLTIIMHMIVNSSSSILYPLAPTVYTYFVYVMIALGIGSVIVTIIKRDIILKPSKDEVAAKELSSIAFTNSGTILFTVVCILLMAYSLFSPLLLG